MKLKYEGENSAAFENGRLYDARIIHDEMGDGYEIRDESAEWYRYGCQFVAAHFSNEGPSALRDSVPLSRWENHGRAVAI